jgi:glutathione peroxidase
MNYDIPLTTLAGAQVNLSAYRGHVLLVVNVASRCGLTPQYAGLEALYREKHARGLEVLGFPCNQFGAQEPGNADAIATFCSTNYDVTFPMFAKLEVNGPGRHPLYTQLVTVADEAGVAGDVKWNFEKFLIDRNGGIQRFRSAVTPEDLKLTTAIEQALGAA